MSARDDYPRPLDQWQEMMDEIDRLRAEVTRLQGIAYPRLIGEL